ncbi:MAG: M20 family metallopeptidase [Eubacteriales bacterium]|nr:M20 family metallopeptidase [Eubacteriales bacterium]
MKYTLEEIRKNINREELLKLTQDLIRIPSHTVYENREKEVAAYIADILEREGIEYCFQSADGDRCNVLATIRGNGTGKSLMLNGHMDTVPVAGMDDPFNPVIVDGYMYGRGSSDMKSGLAAMLYAVLTVHRMKVPLDGDLVFAGVIDEEAAKSTGSRVIAEKGPITDYAIIGEPSSLYPIIAHKGIDYFQIDFHGKAAHSSRPETGANAIYAAADFISAVKAVLIPEFDNLSHPYLGKPTINVGLMCGSAEINKPFLLQQSETFAGVVPDEASVFIDVRWIPGQSIPQIQSQLQALADSILLKNPGISAEVNYIPLPRPAMEISPEEALPQAILESISQVSPETAEFKGLSGFMDSGILYGVAGILSMVFGPGDLSVAHGINEKVEVEQIIKAAQIYTKTALDICVNS